MPPPPPAPPPPQPAPSHTETTTTTSPPSPSTTHSPTFEQPVRHDAHLSPSFVISSPASPSSSSLVASSPTSTLTQPSSSGAAALGQAPARAAASDSLLVNRPTDSRRRPPHHHPHARTSHPTASPSPSRSPRRRTSLPLRADDDDRRAPHPHPHPHPHPPPPTQHHARRRRGGRRRQTLGVIAPTSSGFPSINLFDPYSLLGTPYRGDDDDDDDDDDDGDEHDEETCSSCSDDERGGRGRRGGLGRDDDEDEEEEEEDEEQSQQQQQLGERAAESRVTDRLLPTRDRHGRRTRGRQPRDDDDDDDDDEGGAEADARGDTWGDERGGRRRRRRRLGDGRATEVGQGSAGTLLAPPASDGGGRVTGAGAGARRTRATRAEGTAASSAGGDRRRVSWHSGLGTRGLEDDDYDGGGGGGGAGGGAIGADEGVDGGGGGAGMDAGDERGAVGVGTVPPPSSSLSYPSSSSSSSSSSLSLLLAPPLVPPGPGVPPPPPTPPPPLPPPAWTDAAVGAGLRGADDDGAPLGLAAMVAATTTTAEDELEEVAEEQRRRAMSDIEAFGSLSWKKRRRKYIIIYSAIFCVAYVTSLDANTGFLYLNFACSEFGALGSFSTVAIVQQICYAIAKPPIAKLSDVFGRAQAYCLALLLYVGGYLVMATAPSLAQLIGGIVLQAVGNTGVQVLQSIIIADTSTPKWRGLLIGIVNIPYILNFAIAGPLVNAVMSSSLGWRGGFALWTVILPVAASPLLGTLIVGQRRAMRAGLLSSNKPSMAPSEGCCGCLGTRHPRRVSMTTTTDRRRGSGSGGAQLGRRRGRDGGVATTMTTLCGLADEIDLVGLALFSAAWLLILLPLTLTSRGSGPSATPFYLGLGATLLVGFVAWERRAPQPIMPYRLLSNFSVVCVCIIGVLDFASFYLSWTFLSAFVQVLKGWDQTWTGYFATTQNVTSTVVGILVGWAMAATRRFKRLLVWGVVVRLVGVSLMIRYRNDASPTWMLVACQLLQGIGGGSVAITMQVAVQCAVRHADVAVVTAMELLTVEVGAAIGSAAAGLIFSEYLPGALRANLPNLPDAEVQRIFGSLSAALSYPLGTPERDGIVEAWTSLMRILCLVASLALVPALVLGLLLPDADLPETHAGHRHHHHCHRDSHGSGRRRSRSTEEQPHRRFHSHPHRRHPHHPPRRRRSDVGALEADKLDAMLSVTNGGRGRGTRNGGSGSGANGASAGGFGGGDPGVGEVVVARPLQRHASAPEPLEAPSSQHAS